MLLQYVEGESLAVELLSHSILGWQLLTRDAVLVSWRNRRIPEDRIAALDHRWMVGWTTL